MLHNRFLYPTILVLSFLCLLIFFMCKESESYEPDTLDTMITQANLTWNQVGFKESDYGTPMRLVYSDELVPYYTKKSQLNPRYATEFASETIQDISLTNQSGSDTLADYIQILANRQGEEPMNMKSAGIQEYTLDSTAPLSNAIKAILEVTPLFIGANGSSWSFVKSNIEAACDNIPIALQDKIGRLIYALIKADEVRMDAYENLSDTTLSTLINIIDTGHDTSPTESYFGNVIYPTMKEYNFEPLYQSAQIVAREAEALACYLKDNPPSTPASINVMSPLGRIVIQLGNTDDTYDDFDSYINHALFIDSEGVDTYQIPVGTTRALFVPASVFIDAHGNDSYTYPGYTQGYGCLSTGIFIDAAGNDSYVCEYFGQGVGAFGVGILWDMAGDDSYTGEYRCQGAAHNGIGLLLDDSGKDSYYLYSEGQGFGYINGVGLLCDKAGDDIYTAERDDIDYKDGIYKADNAETMSSFAQGVGYGRRADFSDGYCVPGGLGMLMDFEGVDRYTCGKFGQACGYWYGYGLLYDATGNDTYANDYYVLGGNAHFAVAVFMDKAGDDVYVSDMNMAIGAAHDLSISWFVEYDGNDSYTVPNLSLGAGNDQSFGFFIDLAGNDSYTMLYDVVTLGQSGISKETQASRDDMYTLGLFIDGGGADTYTYTDHTLVEYYTNYGVEIGNNLYWMNPPKGTEIEGWESMGVGIGMDTEGVTIYNLE